MMFKRNPEMRAAYLMIEQFLRDGEMAAELGEFLLAAELSGGGCDIIYGDGFGSAEDEGDDPF